MKMKTRVENFIDALSEYENFVEARSKELKEFGMNEAVFHVYKLGLTDAFKEVWKMVYDYGLCYEDDEEC